MGLDTYIDIIIPTKKPLVYNELEYKEFTFELLYLRKYFNVAQSLDEFIAKNSDNEFSCRVDATPEMTEDLLNIIKSHYEKALYSEDEEDDLTNWGKGSEIYTLGLFVHNFNVLKAFTESYFNFETFIKALHFDKWESSKNEDLMEFMLEHKDDIEWRGMELEITNSY